MEYSCSSFTGLVIRSRDSLIHCLIDLIAVEMVVVQWRWWWCGRDGGGGGLQLIDLLFLLLLATDTCSWYQLIRFLI
ncbi:hypothetical protein HanXRQr2_Chr16g0747161 [Helianthus annuus]|uniref:Uncharacterized protein n=1 Tax=Helianthus annuus TaxID=4232 RepID=A0A9K3DR95_HELAN|nr:hypothetical protein HanXRQr2_Chr16g0747161 [Helianthus annuus]KAJ0438041.1 hypothetical protein HanHA300_Chr16g0609381 [Helianthus annuus]KAJ0442654.1 hypothetical protein HanIR_Chr16g0811901 [Helianthus annuus]KAJ0460367.1 hypothetical protein HanHA89_Chr16g0659991 [Helianthus annuus]KAJ0640808.1 hypothetical protein HanLR1_Chr16g0619961 [Helianthus annuus]